MVLSHDVSSRAESHHKEEVASLGIFLSGGQMCLDFSKGTEISTAELETAAPETQRETGSRVLRRSLATLLRG